MRFVLFGCLLWGMTGCGVMVTLQDQPPTIPASDAGIAGVVAQQQAKAKQDAAARQETPD